MKVDRLVTKGVPRTLVTNGYGKMLLNMCTTLSLTIMNGTCNGDCEGRFTYIGDSGCSVVDYFLLSGELYDNLFDSCSLHVVERIESDHLPVVFSVDFLTQNNDQDCKDEDVHVEKYMWISDNGNIFETELKKEETRVRLEEAIKTIDSDVDLALNMFNNCLKDVATCMKKCSIVKQGKQRQGWFDLECMESRKKCT